MLHCHRRPIDVARALGEWLASAIECSSRFVLAVSGGATPRLLYRVLATELADAIAWERVHLFWVDERFLPPDHPESNVHLVESELIDHVPIPPGQRYYPPTGLENLEEAAAAYASRIDGLLREGDELDAALLGLGEDGHTASLFPGSAQLLDERLVLAVHDSPKPPPRRLTMSLPLLSRFRQLHFLVTGARKSRAVAEALAAEASPAGMLRARARAVHWWLDEAAARDLGPAEDRS